MNKKFIYLSVFFFMNTVIFTEVVSFKQLAHESEKFNTTIGNFPTKNNRISSIATTDSLKKRVEQQADNVQVIMYSGLKNLMENFLDYKKKFGSAIEKNLYKNLSTLDFLKRLIRNRPLVFYTEKDIYRLQEKGVSGEGCFESIGTDCETQPLVLENYLSYDEMQIAAFLGVAVPTFFINNGNRLNQAVLSSSDNFEKEGIYAGLVGARFEKPNLMEWQHVIITPEQNTKNNGYGLHKKDFSLWERFYKEKFPTYQEALSDKSGKYIKIKSGFLFNKSIYKKRIKAAIKPFLDEAEKYALKAHKKAYVRVVGLGLGVWKISDIQEDLMLEVYQEILEEQKYLNISDIEFLYFNKKFTTTDKNSSISISFSKANPADKLMGKHVGKLLVAMYAWDGNSFPGNEYWIGNLTGSGDPAAACCSTIAELQNPLINPAVLGSCEKLI